jgi:hypothetical protein
MGMSDGMAKNWEVVKQEVRLYGEHVRAEIRWIKRLDAPLARKMHHLSGLGPDIHRIMPRTLWYSSVLLGIMVCAVAGYVVLG